MPPRAPVLWGHPPWERPSCSRVMHAAHPWNVTLAGRTSQWLYTYVTPKRVIHSTRMDTRDLGFALTDNWYISGIHLSLPSSVVRVPMSDLSTLLSGTSVHPDDRCLTTLRFLSAHASRDTGPRCLWDPALHGPYITSGQRCPRTGRYTSPQSRAVTCSVKRLSACP